MTKVTSLICGLILILGLVHSTRSATNTFTVGDNKGWTEDTDLKAWLKGKTFHDGDNLVFNYPPGFNVKESTSKEYDECDAGQMTGSFWDTGMDIKTIEGKGDHYYISTSSESCKSGMKMKITAV